MKPSDAISYRIQERLTWLERVFDRIISCCVVVEIPHRHHQKGNLFHIRIRLYVPNAEIIVSRNPDLHKAYRDINVAIHCAFDEARRSLESYSRKRRREVKHLNSLPLGRVVNLVRENSKEGYGFIRTRDERELYFHMNSVLSEKFNDLNIGSEVIYAEENGEEGPQASSVRLIRKIAK